MSNTKVNEKFIATKANNGNRARLFSLCWVVYDSGRSQGVSSNIFGKSIWFIPSSLPVRCVAQLHIAQSACRKHRTTELVIEKSQHISSDHMLGCLSMKLKKRNGVLLNRGRSPKEQASNFSFCVHGFITLLIEKYSQTGERIRQRIETSAKTMRKRPSTKINCVLWVLCCWTLRGTVNLPIVRMRSVCVCASSGVTCAH